MEHKASNAWLFIAQPGIPDSAPTKVYYPLSSFYRYEVSFLQHLFHIPLYPDQTNVNLENTRAQVRYTLLPVIKALGFGLATNKEEEPLPPSPQKYAKGLKLQQTIPPSEITPAIQILVLATKSLVKFELPGTRTPNCPIKSRELYH